MNTETEFYDERIEAVRGRVLRRVILLLLGITVVYTPLYALALTAQKYPGGPWRLLWCELCVLTVGLASVLIGELVFHGAKRDERQAAAKGRFYTYAFYTTVFSTAAVYCLQVAVGLVNRPTGNYLPYNHFPSLLLLLGGLYLMWALKKNRVMLNYTVIEREPRVYRQRVLRNAAFCGGLCGLFTAFSILLYLFLGGQRPDAMISILLAGLATALALVMDYLLLSVTEYESEHAARRGELSRVLPATLWGGTVALTVVTFTRVTITLTDGIHSAAGAQLISRLSLTLGTVSSLLLAAFALYITAECTPRQSRYLRLAGTGYVCVCFASFLLSGLETVFTLYLHTLKQHADIMRIFSTLSTVILVCSGLFILLSVLCLLVGLTVLNRWKWIPRWLLPASSVLCFGRLVCAVITLMPGLAVCSVIGDCLHAILLVLLSVCISGLRRVKFDSSDL